MSADSQQPTEPLCPSPSPAPPETGLPQPPAWPEQHTRPQTWPEQPTVPGQHTSPRQAAWPRQPPAAPPPAWAQHSPAAPPPSAWAQHPPAAPPPSAWAQQPPAAPPPSAWAQQPPAAPAPPAWAQQPPAAPPAAPSPSAWPPPPVPGWGMPGHGGHGHERYQIREEPQPQYREQYEPAQQAQEWAPLPLYRQEMYPMTVAPKSPAVSVLLSVFIPGLGSMVNDNAGVGVTILILNIIGWILAIALIGIPIAIGTWIWGLVDAHRSAQRWNRAHGIIS